MASLVFMLLPVAERKGLREIFFLFPLAIPTVLCSQEPGKTHHGVLHAQDEAGKCLLHDHKFNIPLPCKAYDFCVKHGNSTGDEIKASERGKTDSRKKGKKKIKLLPQDIGFL